MLRVKRKSDWSYKTSSSGGLGLGFVSVGIGSITLNSPAGYEVVFTYKSLGAGISEGLGLPKSINVGFSREEYPSIGQLFVLEQFEGWELEARDIEGLCVIVEVSAAAGDGASFTAMVLGY